MLGPVEGLGHCHNLAGGAIREFDNGIRYVRHVCNTDAGIGTIRAAPGDKVVDEISILQTVLGFDCDAGAAVMRRIRNCGVDEELVPGDAERIETSPGTFGQKLSGQLACAGAGLIVRIVYADEESCRCVAYLNSPLGLSLTISAAVPSVT